MGILQLFKKFAFVKLRILKYKSVSTCQNVTGQPILFHPLQIGVVNAPHYYSHYSYFEARDSNSEICIGNHVRINNNCSIEALSKITIEDHVLIGVNCSFLDNDGHNLAIDLRDKGPVASSEIHIQKNVFIGDHVTILKGVTIGKNSVIGNHSVVTKSIAANVIAAGNPAKVIKEL